MTFPFKPYLFPCAVALLLGACGSDSKMSTNGDDPMRPDRGDMGTDAGADASTDPGPSLPEESCFAAKVAFDATQATLFGKVKAEHARSVFAFGERLFVNVSEGGLLEIMPGESEPVRLTEAAPGKAKLVGKDWYFIDDTTVWHMADTAGATPTVIRTDLVAPPYVRIVGDKAVYQQVEAGVQVFPLDGSAAFMLANVASMSNGVEHAGLFYYFDRDAERPFRVEPKAGAVPEVLSAGDDTFGDFGGGIGTNGKYVVWETSSAVLKGAPIGNPTAVTIVATVPPTGAFNDGVYGLTFVGDRLYFAFESAVPDPARGNQAYSNIGYTDPQSGTCGVVVSDKWAFDATYDFILGESKLWIVTRDGGPVYTKPL